MGVTSNDIHCVAIVNTDKRQFNFVQNFAENFRPIQKSHKGQ